MSSMNNYGYPDDWKEAATEVLKCLWSPYEKGEFVFIGTRSASTGEWKEHPLEVPISKKALVDFFKKYSRDEYDLYFCANAFRSRRRSRKYAMPTYFACVDIGDAIWHEFIPSATLVWRTSPERTQGIWVFKENLSVEKAESIAQNLAYTFGARYNDCSITKYLRIPFTINHELGFEKPMVSFVMHEEAPFERAIQVPRRVPEYSSERKNTANGHLEVDYCDLPNPPTGRKYARRILKKYASRLGMIPRALLGHEYLLFPNCCDATSSIVCALHELGASESEIYTAVWNSIYFMDKYGPNRRALHTDVTRTINELEDRRAGY